MIRFKGRPRVYDGLGVLLEDFFFRNAIDSLGARIWHIQSYSGFPQRYIKEHLVLYFGMQPVRRKSMGASERTVHSKLINQNVSSSYFRSGSVMSSNDYLVLSSSRSYKCPSIIQHIFLTFPIGSRRLINIFD